MSSVKSFDPDYEEPTPATPPEAHVVIKGTARVEIKGETLFDADLDIDIAASDLATVVTALVSQFFEMLTNNPKTHADPENLSPDEEAELSRALDRFSEELANLAFDAQTPSVSGLFSINDMLGRPTSPSR